MIEVAKFISTCLKIGGVKSIHPFVFVPSNGKSKPVWLEFSANCPPTPSDVFKTVPIPEHQTLERYMSLPEIEIDGMGSHAVVAERIVDGEIIFYRLKSGCLWGMVPRDANLQGVPDEPAPAGPS